MLIMWSLVILFIVSITNVATLRVEMKRSPLRDLDVDSIFDVLNHQQNHYENYLSEHNQELSSESKSIDDLINNEDNSHYGSLKSREITNLIEQATHNKYVNDVPPVYKANKEKIIVNHKSHNLHKVDNRNEKHKSEDHFPLDDRTLKQILTYVQAHIKPKRKPRKPVLKKQKHIKNTPKSANVDKKHDRASLDDYSKIYIILNPQAIQKSNDKDTLSDLISKISSATYTKERAVAKQDQRYKGFPVKEGLFARRARRDSREKYDLKDSLEDSYKQKRSRNDHGGGGRTAIPYIRHRGDIYEREV